MSDNQTLIRSRIGPEFVTSWNWFQHKSWMTFFFAISHGKNACDGVGGTIKRLAAYAILQRPTTDQILNPMIYLTLPKMKSLEWLAFSLVHHMLRKFLYFSNTDLPIHQNLKELEKTTSSFHIEMTLLRNEFRIYWVWNNNDCQLAFKWPENWRYSTWLISCLPVWKWLVFRHCQFCFYEKSRSEH